MTKNEALEALVAKWKVLETDFTQNGRDDISHTIKRCREQLEAALTTTSADAAHHDGTCDCQPIAEAVPELAETVCGCAHVEGSHYEGKECNV